MKKDFNKTMLDIGLFLIAFIVIIVIAFIVLDKTGNNPLNNNSKNEEIKNNEIAVKKAITRYLANNEKANDIEGNCFASLENYGYDEKENNTLYIQYYVQCYKLGDKVIETLNGYTIPAKVILEKSKSEYNVKELIKPSESNINTLFPLKISKELSKAKEDGTIKMLKDSVDKQATDYYGALKIVD